MSYRCGHSIKVRAIGFRCGYRIIVQDMHVYPCYGLYLKLIGVGTNFRLNLIGAGTRLLVREDIALSEFPLSNGVYK